MLCGNGWVTGFHESEWNQGHQTPAGLDTVFSLNLSDYGPGVMLPVKEHLRFEFFLHDRCRGIFAFASPTEVHYDSIFYEANRPPHFPDHQTKIDFFAIKKKLLIKTTDGF